MNDLMVNPDDLAIAVIDVQPGFLDGWMAGPSEPMLARIELLFGLATVYDLPLLATFEQPVEKKGWLPPRLEPYFPAHGQRYTKQTFNCCGEPSILAAIEALDRSQIAVAGGETDVCVLQSVLGLITAGKQVFLLEDALFSSEPNVGPAIRRMERRRSHSFNCQNALLRAASLGCRLPPGAGLPATNAGAVAARARETAAVRASLSASPPVAGCGHRGQAIGLRAQVVKGHPGRELRHAENLCKLP